VPAPATTHTIVFYDRSELTEPGSQADVYLKDKLSEIGKSAIQREGRSSFDVPGSCRDSRPCAAL
jgi:hypothetical protein